MPNPQHQEMKMHASGTPGSLRVVHVHWLALDVAEERVERLYRVLRADEVERAARFAFPELRNRFVAGRAKMREKLAEALQCAAGDLVFVEGPQGKPALDSGKVDFNLSHSGGDAVLAIAPPGYPLGVDIECVSRKANITGIAGRFFPPGDAEAILRLPEPEARRFFFRHWTAREAVMKATGLGLRLSPQRIHVRFEGSSGMARVEPGPEDVPETDWHLTILREDSRITATLATLDPVQVVQHDASAQ
jgi:4'-phosphopantetheinyl transferase